MNWDEILDALEERLDHSVAQQHTTLEQSIPIKDHIQGLREAMPLLIEAYEAICQSPSVTEPLISGADRGEQTL